MATGNMLVTKSRTYYGFFHPIMSWEYHCFGYRKEGNDSIEVLDHYDVEVSSDRIKATPSTKIIKYADFYRHAEYATNPLFWILELLMGLVSRIRVYLSKFALIGALIGVMISDGEPGTITNALFIFFVASYGASFAVSLIGYIVRKAFGLDQRTDDICEENGWKKWSEYEDK